MRGRGNDFRELSVSSNVVRVSGLFNKVGGDGVEFLAYVEGGRQSPLLIGIEHDERIGADDLAQHGRPAHVTRRLM